MTALGSVPNAHTQGEPEGTWNLEKLHLELKYLGRKLAEAKLQREQRDTLEQRAGALQVSQQIFIQSSRRGNRKHNSLVTCEELQPETRRSVKL